MLNQQFRERLEKTLPGHPFVLSIWNKPFIRKTWKDVYSTGAELAA
jgi:hypothetical protein